VSPSPTPFAPNLLLLPIPLFSLFWRTILVLKFRVYFFPYTSPAHPFSGAIHCQHRNFSSSSFPSCLHVHAPAKRTSFPLKIVRLPLTFRCRDPFFSERGCVLTPAVPIACLPCWRSSRAYSAPTEDPPTHHLLILYVPHLSPLKKPGSFPSLENLPAVAILTKTSRPSSVTALPSVPEVDQLSSI